MPVTEKYSPQHPVRVVTAASLFDGHDAAINVMRRIIQGTGAEVVHLGHNRSVAEIVQAAVAEDAQAVAVSSYQGGHNEFFRYMRDLLDEQGARHVRIYGGGGGVIVPDETAALQDYGISRIYSPEDGRLLGLQGMINDLVEGSDFDPLALELGEQGILGLRDGRFTAEVGPEQPLAVARLISLIENRERLPAELADPLQRWLTEHPADGAPAVFGVTGTGGAGKSSLVDELITRLLRDQPAKHVAVVSVDPSKRRTGGALLGDRIRMNSLSSSRVFMRSLATRGAQAEVSAATGDVLDLLKRVGFDLLILETSGIGQGDSAVVDLSDVTAYVMTAEYGASSQLEKIDMIDYADLLVLNKFEQKGAEDALRDVRKQYRRSHELFVEPPDEELPVFGTIASRFNDLGVTALYHAIVEHLKGRGDGRDWASTLPVPGVRASASHESLIPAPRARYLSDIADTVRGYKERAEGQIAAAGDREALRRALELVGARDELQAKLTEVSAGLTAESVALLDEWPALREAYAGDTFSYSVRGREFTVPLAATSLAGSRIARVTLPPFRSEAEVLRFRLLENLPGHFPFTASVFPFRRQGEAPKRQFAGEGPPIRTNERFHYLSRDDEAKRLSTAFDSVTLYGEDPDERPDIWARWARAASASPPWTT